MNPTRTPCALKPCASPPEASPARPHWIPATVSTSEPTDAPARDEHLDAPPLFFGRTEGATPFRFALHVGDVGHTLVVGPTGAGKSVLLALMALQFRRYAKAQVFAFDFGGSIRAAALAIGGDWHDLGGALTEDADAPVALQPLALIDDVAERSWAAEWIQARSWRLMAFGCLVLAAGLAGGLVWQAARGTITPWVVQVDRFGQAQAVAPADASYRPTDPQIAFHLARFIEDVRGLPADAVVLRQAWLRAYEFTTDRGAAALNDYARRSDPFAKLGKMQISVEVSSVIRASPESFRVAWTERRYESGQLAQ